MKSGTKQCYIGEARLSRGGDKAFKNYCRERTIL
jgi:hypothetical protein